MGQSDDSDAEQVAVTTHEPSATSRRTSPPQASSGTATKRPSPPAPSTLANRQRECVLLLRGSGAAFVTTPFQHRHSRGRWIALCVGVMWGVALFSQAGCGRTTAQADIDSDTDERVDTHVTDDLEDISADADVDGEADTCALVGVRVDVLEECIPRSVSADGPADPCNGLDDDCDGVTDEDDSSCHCGKLGAPCAAGFECDNGRCYSSDRQRLFVPADSFWMGCNPVLDPLCTGDACIDLRHSTPSFFGYQFSCPGNPFTDELPQVRHALSAFGIDRYPVTVLDYLACVRSGDCAGGPDGRLCASLGCPRPEDVSPDKAELRKPMTSLSWSEATGYCSAQSGRLCTEAEWEMAARGGCAVHCSASDGESCCARRMPTYPWGEAVPTCDNHPFSNLTYCRCPGDDGFSQPVTRVDAFPSGASVYGVEDMVGNVGQWVQDCYDCYGSLPKQPQCCKVHVYRGYEVSFAFGGGCTVPEFCCGLEIPLADACAKEGFPGQLATARAGSRTPELAVGLTIIGARCCYDVVPR